jgi:hypothetical protein
VAFLRRDRPGGAVEPWPTAIAIAWSSETTPAWNAHLPPRESRPQPDLNLREARAMKTSRRLELRDELLLACREILLVAQYPHATASSGGSGTPVAQNSSIDEGVRPAADCVLATSFASPWNRQLIAGSAGGVLVSRDLGTHSGRREALAVAHPARRGEDGPAGGRSLPLMNRWASWLDDVSLRRSLS